MGHWKWLPPLTLALAAMGCGGSGDEAWTATPPAPAEGTVKPAPATSAPPVKQAETKPAIPAPDVKPDLKDVPAVVKGDFKGGEAASGGSAHEFLEQKPDASLIKDEPLTVKAPKGLNPLASVIPASNPLTKGKVELGKQLYFEPRISLDGTVSCATCHNPSKGWTDQAPVSTGINGQKGGRSAPTVLNTVYGKSMFWDGRALSLEDQAKGPPQNPIEMGKQSHQQIVERLRKISGYREQFQKVFGTDVTLDGMVKAIASFERATALSGNSAYDQYNAGENKALSDSQKRGMVLFGLRLNLDDDFKTDVVLKKADCTSCHAGANFTDEAFHNLGIGWDDKQKKFSDDGRVAIDTKDKPHTGAFKTPTVREAVNTAPYMHDGSFKTLEEVVEHYNKGGNPNPWLDKDIKKLNLTDAEKKDVVEFMKALSGETVSVTLPTLPPGPDGKSPTPADALEAPSAPKAALGNVLHLPIR
jgi:cytochrome c peroxidase